MQICEGTVIAIHATFTELRPKDKKGGRLIVNNAGIHGCTHGCIMHLPPLLGACSALACLAGRALCKICGSQHQGPLLLRRRLSPPPTAHADMYEKFVLHNKSADS